MILYLLLVVAFTRRGHKIKGTELIWINGHQNGAEQKFRRQNSTNTTASNGISSNKFWTNSDSQPGRTIWNLGGWKWTSCCIFLNTHSTTVWLGVSISYVVRPGQQQNIDRPPGDGIAIHHDNVYTVLHRARSQSKEKNNLPDWLADRPSSGRWSLHFDSVFTYED